MIKMETYSIHPRRAYIIPVHPALAERYYEVEMTHRGRIRTTTRTRRTRTVAEARRCARNFVHGDC